MAKQIITSGIGARWAQGLSGKTDKIRAGIENVTESPGRKAAAQKSVWLANVTNAADLWAARVGALTTEDWKAATLAKVDRVASGAQAATEKFEAKMQPVLAHLQTGLNALDSMPRGDLERNIERSAKLARHMAAFKKR